MHHSESIVPLLAKFDWGNVTAYLCMAALAVAWLIVTGGKGPRFPGDGPPESY